MKTYTNKSNAARAAKVLNGGSLDGLELKGKEGAWYYAIPIGNEHVPVDDGIEKPLRNGMGTPVKTPPAKKAAPRKVAALEFERPARATAAPATVASKGNGKATPKGRSTTAHTFKADKPAAKKAAKKVAKKAPAKKAAAPRVAVVEYDVKHGPTQGRIRGYHIDTDRDEKHGVKRRSAGTIGGRLWSIFDKLSAKTGKAQDLDIATVKAHKDVGPFNPNKVVIEFYYWRRYHGVRGRGKKQKVAA
jgi:hypothetical protein